MLSGLLRSEIAIEVNIKIMRAFVAMRHFLTQNTQLFQRIETIECRQITSENRFTKIENELSKQNDQIHAIFQKLDEGLVKPQQGIFFDGQIFDAYNFVCDLVRMAQKQIVLIDNWCDDTTLKILDNRKENVSCVIYTANFIEKLQKAIEKHNLQYPIITIKEFKSCHDRYLCIDNDIYHIGASLKDLGKKWFGFDLLKDWKTNDLIEKILVVSQ